METCAFCRQEFEVNKRDNLGYFENKSICSPCREIMETTFSIDLCEWIRANVPESKLLEVKKFISAYENYFDADQPKMIEHVYRGVKNSIKIEYAYDESISFTRWLLYLLSSNKKEFVNDSDIETDLLNVVKKTSFLYNFFTQTKKAKGKVKKKGHYYLFAKATLTFLGTNVMFYYILTSVVSIVEKALHNEKYKLEGILGWQEGIAVYVLSEFKRK